MPYSVPRFRPGPAVGFLSICLICGCTSTRSTTTALHTPVEHASEEIPEELLLDVGIARFEMGDLDEKEIEKQGTSETIRNAESHFIPYHLKSTLQQTGHWGAVRVVPDQAASVDLLINGTIVKSNGEKLKLRIRTVDAAGDVWLEKTYEMNIDERSYRGAVIGQKDVYQPVYNRIANDLAALRSNVGQEETNRIRTISKMRFAADLAPDPFETYLEKDGDRYRLSRLPADDDTMIARLMQIRDREYMYVDTLDEYYERFYQDMWPEYENWRKFNQTEIEALREIKRSATQRIVGGVLLIAAAVALEVTEVENVETLRDVLVLGGGAVVVDGIDVSKQGAIHRAGIEELSESFSADLDTIVVEFEGKQVELTGTTQEQFRQWRDLLRKIYQEETGFDSDVTEQREVPNTNVAMP